MGAQEIHGPACGALFRAPLCPLRLNQAQLKRQTVDIRWDGEAALSPGVSGRCARSNVLCSISSSSGRI
jgi:hypothetical protein